MLLDELELISKIQKNLKDSYQSIGDAMISGGVDNIEKYKYLLGQAHAYYKISQDISNLLKKKGAKWKTRQRKRYPIRRNQKLN